MLEHDGSHVLRLAAMNICAMTSTNVLQVRHIQRICPFINFLRTSGSQKWKRNVINSIELKVKHLCSPLSPDYSLLPADEVLLILFTTPV